MVTVGVHRRQLLLQVFILRARVIQFIHVLDIHARVVALCGPCAVYLPAGGMYRRPPSFIAPTTPVRFCMVGCCWRGNHSARNGFASRCLFTQCSEDDIIVSVCYSEQC